MQYNPEAESMIGGYANQNAAMKRTTADEPCGEPRPTIEELHAAIACMIDRVTQARVRVSMNADALLGPRPENSLVGGRPNDDSTIGLVRTLSFEIAMLEHHIARF